MAAKRRPSGIGPLIPRYALFEEAPGPADPRFIHVETIARRSAPRDWTIRTHAHGDLHQLLLIVTRGGEMRIEAERRPFGGGSLLVVPAGSVHAFHFEAGTRGYVVSFADALLRPTLAEPAIASLARAGRIMPAPQPSIEPLIRSLSAELGAGGAAATMAAEAWLRLILVHTARALEQTGEAGATPPSREAALVARFRAQIEARLGENWTVAHHARALGISPSRLRATCVAVAGEAPIRLIQQRSLIEARRLLALGSAQVAEVGYALGFLDPAYFSRWFSRNEGCPPATYRARMARAGPTRTEESRILKGTIADPSIS